MVLSDDGRRARCRRIVGLGGVRASAVQARRGHRRQVGPVAGVVGRLTDEPESTKEWTRGADGERRVAVHLERHLAGRAILLHDRQVGRRNIDHLAVAPSGVWVIDAKNYAGRVEHRIVAGRLRAPDYRIFIGGRDKTALVASLAWQVDAVRVALGDRDVVIHPVLCFVNGENWRLFQRPFVQEGVVATWPSNLCEAIASAGALVTEQCAEIARRLEERFRVYGGG